ncbi:MAG: alcohol dehydrogenase catalytic domain-containing protein [Gammaproteobacteria bacterium]
MKAAVTTKPGSPEVIELLQKSIPSAKKGWVLIKIKAFGLNRSEIFTRRGDSPNVKFPRVQGIECVGLAVIWLEYRDIGMRFGWRVLSAGYSA